MSAALEARNVTVTVGGRDVLIDASIAVSSGEVVALVGPNGAGKSTLLSVLAGDRVPSHGIVHMRGVPLADVPIAERARVRSVLLQSNAVSFPYAVGDVVAMGRAPWQRTSAADDDQEWIDRAMSIAEVAQFATRPVTALSGGESARVAFARTYAQATPIELLDEPTAALDIRHQHRVLASVRDRVTREAGSAIVVLHDLALAAAYADRIALLADGVVVAIGTPTEVLRSDLLTATYRHPISVMTAPDGGLAVFAHPTVWERTP